MAGQDLVSSSVIPALHYRDTNAAFRWLQETLGLSSSWVDWGDDGAVEHGELRWGGGLISINRARDQYERMGPAYICLEVEAAEDVDRHYQRVCAAGAQTDGPPCDIPFVGYSFTVSDPEGNAWNVGTFSGLKALRPAEVRNRA
jgi:uncharacterized glyoxalase superfamily protein PhnB